jgi:mono/diheme cytochrome c family protein
MKKPIHIPKPCVILTLGIFLFAASCAYQSPLKDQNNPDAAFARVKPVLELNCVNCHAANRLQGMPSLTDTKALAGLIGPANLIVPGKPEQSRFYLVTTFADDQAGAMPPTGHAMSRREVAVLREWIEQGALLPKETIKLNIVGASQRSR